ncbi:hypothetical protein [Nostoc sp. FACHB-145]|uniref:hypothetical protein n=1 Tax=Nostoc sp. FACHB-145 TaxID=2692836 RepID=UPI001F558730|nr:hypothetical protein [Nostoc sp. FACHB-145]
MDIFVDCPQQLLHQLVGKSGSDCIRTCPCNIPQSFCVLNDKVCDRAVPLKPCQPQKMLSQLYVLDASDRVVHPHSVLGLQQQQYQ